MPLLKQLLEAEGVEQSKALCEHFTQSRAELFEIVVATGIRTFSGLIERFGTGKGCDICKPVVASILASTSSDHILDGEQAVAAGLQRPLPGQHPEERQLLGGAAGARR